MIAFEGVSVAYGPTRALADVDLTVEAGALCTLVGPSGSGKSTLLRLVNRLVAPVAGRVTVRGENVAQLDAAALRRSIGYAIQGVGLFPHRTVAENVATVPRLLGWPKARIAARVEAMLELVRLDPGAVRHRRPAELSGGQAQRVGLARALAADPDILLMDEPFGAVDPITRRTLRAELKRIHAETGKTIMLVTHDPAEALALATQLVVLRDGRIVSAGAPESVLDTAVDPFVRDLLLGDDPILRLRRLDRARVRDAMTPEKAASPTILDTAPLSEALARMVEARSGVLGVCSREGTPLGSITLQDLVEHRP